MQPGKGKKILIVEDENAIANVLDLKLKHEGFETRIATDGAEAMDLINTGTFDLIILDLVMPKKDGFSVLKELKKGNVGTTVFVMSNLSQPEDVEKVIGYGVKRYFAKSETHISTIVAEIIREIKNNGARQ